MVFPAGRIACQRGVAALLHLLGMNGEPSVPPLRAGRSLAVVSMLLVVAFAAVFCERYLHSTSKWWYEDDPAQYSNAARIANPVLIFAAPSILQHFGTGTSLVPMQVLSYWLDLRLSGVSPRFAYLHSLLSTIATALLVSLVLGRLTGDRFGAAMLAMLWLCLPSTIAVHYFLGTRHYMEGLLWTLAACYFLIRGCEQPKGSAILEGVLFWLCAIAAVLSKEIYVAVLPAFVLPYAAKHGRVTWSAAAPLVALGYAGYRLALLGWVRYPVRPPTGLEYLRYLGVLPYTFSAGRLGFVFYGCLIAGVAWLLRRGQPGVGCELAFAFVLLAAGLLATYPTAAPVLLTHPWPGTWYRGVFIVQTIVLLGAGYLLLRHAPRRARIIGLSLIALLLLPGVRTTRVYWEGRFARSEAEGRFYLTHPDQLVYSEEDASWFLPGLERLYGVSPSHYINKSDIGNAHTKAMLESFPTIWRYRNGQWAPDDSLFARLCAETAIKGR